MSFFVLVAVRENGILLRDAFCPRFQLMDARQLPLGIAVSGDKPKHSCAVVTLNGVSDGLVDHGPKKERSSRQFLEVIELLTAKGSAVSVLLHWATGNISTERDVTKERRKVSFAAFAQLYPKDIELDVRYVISATCGVI